MTCLWIDLPGGGRAIVCGVRINKKKRCYLCGMGSTLLCDGPGCDKPVCERCSRRVGTNRDLCLTCQLPQISKPKQGALL